MSDAVTLFDEVLREALTEVKSHDLSTDDATTAVKNLKTLSECRPPTTSPEPEPTPEPNTVLEKVKAGMWRAWDNETTRVLIKAGGAFAGVALVTWTTVRRDHVLTREALSQANQRNS
jgi:hypothetical protein